MLIHQSMVPSPQFQNRLIVLIQKCHVPVAMAVRCIVFPLEAEENVLISVASNLEISGPNREVGESGPDEVASVGEDVGTGLERAVVLAIGEATEGRDEKVAFFDLVGGGNGDVEGWW